MTSDAIRPSQDGKAYYPGLLTKNQFNKIDSSASNANVGYQAGSTYVGVGSETYTTIYCGFRPEYLSIRRTTATTFQNAQIYDMGGWNCYIWERVADLGIDLTTLLEFTTAGFRVYGSWNRPNSQYYYVAIRQQA